MKNKQKIYVLLLIVITAVLFSNTINNDFTNWDDPEYIHNNPYIKDLSKEGVKNIFLKPVMHNYHPLTILSYAIEYKFFGLNPKAYHFTNYILHILNTLLVFFFIKLLSKRVEIAFITALLFAIHPMHVESVAWISERKDVLYTFFFIFSLIFAVKFIKSDKNNLKYIVISFILFVLSLLSKSAAVVLPVIILLCVYFINKKITKKDILVSIPFFVLSFLFGLIALNTQEEAMGDLSNKYSLFNRIIMIFYAVYFYIVRFIFPHSFSTLHTYPTLDNNLLPMEYYIAPIIIISIIIFLFITKKEFKQIIIFGLLFFIISIALVIQIIPVGQAIISERYTYVPYIGLSFIAAVSFIKLSEKYQKNNKFLFAIGFIYIGFLTISTWQQNKVWKNNISLWTKAIESDPKNSIAYYNIGLTKFHDFNDYIKAIENYNKAIKYNPKYVEAYNNRGIAKRRIKDYEAAIADFSMAIKINPGDYVFYNNRGLTNKDIQDYTSAIKDFSKAIELSPNNLTAYNNRAKAKTNIRDFSGAIEDLNKIIELNPIDATAYMNRGNIYTILKDYYLAIMDFNKAIEINPDYSEAYFNKAIVKSTIQEHQAALINFNKAIELKPDYLEAYYQRAITKGNLQDYINAIKDFDKAIELNTNYADAYFNRGVAKYFLNNLNDACLDWKKASEIGHIQANNYLQNLCK